MKTTLFWLLRFLPAAILLQTLFFKFTAAPESVYIFTKLGAEPVGRIGSGVVELIAGILLLIPRFSWLGAGLALGTMSGAIASHLGPLGIDVLGDHGQLFAYALLTWCCSATLLWIEKSTWLPLVPFLKKN